MIRNKMSCRKTNYLKFRLDYTNRLYSILFTNSTQHFLDVHLIQSVFCSRKIIDSMGKTYSVIAALLSSGVNHSNTIRSLRFRPAYKRSSNILYK